MCAENLGDQHKQLKLGVFLNINNQQFLSDCSGILLTISSVFGLEMAKEVSSLGGAAEVVGLGIGIRFVVLLFGGKTLMNPAVRTPTSDCRFALERHRG